MDSNDKNQSYQCDLQKFKWRNSDWFWVSGILIFIIIMLVTYIIKVNGADNYLSILSTCISIVLSIIAIMYAFIQTNINDRLNSSLKDKIDSIQLKMAELHNYNEDRKKLEKNSRSEKVGGIFSKIKNNNKLDKQDLETIDQFLDDVLNINNKKSQIETDSVFDFMDE